MAEKPKKPTNSTKKSAYKTRGFKSEWGTHPRIEGDTKNGGTIGIGADKKTVPGWVINQIINDHMKTEGRKRNQTMRAATRKAESKKFYADEQTLKTGYTKKQRDAMSKTTKSKKK